MTSGFDSKDGGAILLGGQRYSFSWIPGDTLRDSFYFHLAGAIEERCLEDLKLCQQCKKKLHLRDKYCSDACKNASTSKRRSDQKFMQSYRANRREKMIEKARELLGREKPVSLRVVKQRTGLSERILKKERVIRGMNS